jgi:hypothetical protein
MLDVAQLGELSKSRFTRDAFRLETLGSLTALPHRTLWPRPGREDEAARSRSEELAGRG